MSEVSWPPQLGGGGGGARTPPGGSRPPPGRGGGAGGAVAGLLGERPGVPRRPGSPSRSYSPSVGSPNAGGLNSTAELQGSFLSSTFPGSAQTFDAAGRVAATQLPARGPPGQQEATWPRTDTCFGSLESVPMAPDLQAYGKLRQAGLEWRLASYAKSSEMYDTMNTAMNQGVIESLARSYDAWLACYAEDAQHREADLERLRGRLSDAEVECDRERGASLKLREQLQAMRATLSATVAAEQLERDRLASNGERHGRLEKHAEEAIAGLRRSLEEERAVAARLQARLEELTPARCPLDASPAERELADTHCMLEELRRSRAVVEAERDQLVIDVAYLRKSLEQNLGAGAAADRCSKRHLRRLRECFVLRSCGPEDTWTKVIDAVIMEHLASLKEVQSLRPAFEEERRTSCAAQEQLQMLRSEHQETLVECNNLRKNFEAAKNAQKALRDHAEDRGLLQGLQEERVAKDLLRAQLEAALLEHRDVQLMLQAQLEKANSELGALSAENVGLSRGLEEERSSKSHAQQESEADQRAMAAKHFQLAQCLREERKHYEATSERLSEEQRTAASLRARLEAVDRDDRVSVLSLKAQLSSEQSVALSLRSQLASTEKNERSEQATALLLRNRLELAERIEQDNFASLRTQLARERADVTGEPRFVDACEASIKESRSVASTEAPSQSLRPPSQGLLDERTARSVEQMIVDLAETHIGESPRAPDAHEALAEEVVMVDLQTDSIHEWDQRGVSKPGRAPETVSSTGGMLEHVERTGETDNADSFSQLEYTVTCISVESGQHQVVVDDELVEVRQSSQSSVNQWCSDALYAPPMTFDLRVATAMTSCEEQDIVTLELNQPEASSPDDPLDSHCRSLPRLDLQVSPMSMHETIAVDEPELVEQKGTDVICSRRTDFYSATDSSAEGEVTHIHELYGSVDAGEGSIVSRRSSREERMVFLEEQDRRGMNFVSELVEVRESCKQLIDPSRCDAPADQADSSRALSPRAGSSHAGSSRRSSRQDSARQEGEILPQPIRRHSRQDGLRGSVRGGAVAEPVGEPTFSRPDCQELDALASSLGSSNRLGVLSSTGGFSTEERSEFWDISKTPTPQQDEEEQGHPMVEEESSVSSTGSSSPPSRSAAELPAGLLL